MGTTNLNSGDFILPVLIMGLILAVTLNADTRDRFIMSDSNNKLYIKHHNSDDFVRLFIETGAFEMSLAAKQSIGWKAGEWIHIQAYWYDLHMSSPLETTTYIVPAILVNGQQSESTHNGKYQNLTAATDLFVGNKNGISSLSANGTMDELKIYDEFWLPSISSVTIGETQEYNIKVSGATAFKNKGLRATFIALSAAYLAAIILFFAVRKKLIAQQR